MNKKGAFLYFHQGWTDIMNCLSLINYYSNLYNKLYLIIRNDSKEILEFYTKNINNLQIFYVQKFLLDTYGITPILNKNNKIRDMDFIGIGEHDRIRHDNYKNKFSLVVNNCFVKGFYSSYDIPYITRVNNFTFNRDYELENKTYTNFISIHGNDYIVYHEIIENYDNNKKIINLNGISNLFFDYIKVLENAYEIHLLDSVWGSFIYLLDAKYKLFQNKNIILYARRGYRKMFEEPIKLDNWTII